MRTSGNGANLGFEKKLWEMADKMRGHMDASEYKHVVLGLVFLKYISDSFREKYNELAAAEGSVLADPEDRASYIADNIFWLPKEARWEAMRSRVVGSNIGDVIDGVMTTIEEENPALDGALPKNYSRPELNKQRLAQLVDIVGEIDLHAKFSGVKDPLGRVYEYFLGRFAATEGKGGGEFYTPQCVVQLLVEMIAPYKGSVYDPCCGSGGMFVQSEKFVKEHGGDIGDIAVYGQESNHTTWRLAKMNLAIRGIDFNLGSENADTFRQDLHSDLRADFILANPPFNMSDWGADHLKFDYRWRYGLPSKGNANFAWVQHIAHHLASDGKAAFVLANGSLSSNQVNDREIRKALIDDDIVDCVVYLPPQLFYTTQISVSLWFLSKNKRPRGKRDRRGEVLFIYAYDMGKLVDRTHRELSDQETEKIVKTYRSWCGEDTDTNYQDLPGFCKSATRSEIEDHLDILVPGRYVGFDRSRYEALDMTELREEFDEIRNRLRVSEETSAKTLCVLEDVLNG